MRFKRVFSVLLVVILTCASALKAPALTNIVTNGDLNSGDGAWRFTVSLEVGGGHVIIGGTFWQDLNTVPGRDYIVRFAVKYSMPRLHWGNQTYTTFTNIPAPSTWQTVYLFVHATSSVTRLVFENISSRVGLDDIMVGWLLEPASILTQPVSRTSPEAGSAGFTIQADGGPPLFYQWFLNDEPIAGATNHYIVKNDITSADQGAYHVIVSNAVNAVTSAVATLSVDSSPKEPQIVLHPESQEVSAGYWHYLRTASIGSLPLSYQWLFNGEELPGATNATLAFGYADYTNSGTYIVRVSNHKGSALSLPATLNVYAQTNPGGFVRVDTWMPPFPTFDVDGYTRLTRTNFIAQLYAGPSPGLLRAVGGVIHFILQAPGCVYSPSVQIPDAPPGNLVYGQLRAWDPAWGSSYEEARARGGKFGFSPIVSVVSAMPPAQLPRELPITSFTLRYGLPNFTTGELEFSRRLPDGTVEWLLVGEPGFRYLIEKRFPPHNWQPLTILTNDTGRVTFTDPDQLNSSLQFYRSRMLE